MLIDWFLMEPVILFRNSFVVEDEFEVAKQCLPVVENRALCKDNFVICRYSSLPYYKELEQDLAYQGSKLVNTLDQYLWIANFDYYEDLKDYTFETWTERTFPYTKYEGPFVVKGATNSKKHNWNKMMYAETKRDAIEVASLLREDSLITYQPIIYRKYTPLKTFEIGINGVRFTNEWRFFYYMGSPLTHAYYWSEADDIESPQIDQAGIDFADEIAGIAAQHCNFFVLDIGEKEEGGWVLIEVNDGQMSGLSCNTPANLYRNLASAIEQLPWPSHIKDTRTPEWTLGM